MNEPAGPAGGLRRRLAAVFYDTLLLVAILLIATMVPVMIAGGADEAPRWLVRAWVVLVSFGFFGWFWTHGGQTLGMRAWRLELVRFDGTAVTWADAAKRFLAALVSWAPAGLGFIWCVFDRDRLAWHDRISRTRLVVRPKGR